MGKNDEMCTFEYLGMLGLARYYGGIGGSNMAEVGRVGKLIDTAFVCALEALDDSKTSCTDAHRQQTSGHCILSACDCQCMCSSHGAPPQAWTLQACMLQEGPDFMTSTKWKDGSTEGKTAGPWTAAGGIDTSGKCASTDWKTNNGCF